MERDLIATIEQRTRVIVRELATSHAQLMLWNAVVDQTFAKREMSPAHELALDVQLSLDHGAEPAIELGVVTTLFDAAVYLMDHTLDDELTAPWTPASAALTWTTLAAAVLPSVLRRMPIAADRREQLITTYFRRTLEIANGEQVELSRDRPPTTSEVDAVVAQKTGTRRALFCELGAIAAGASVEVVAAMADFGQELGRARQLRSDLLDLVAKDTSRDISAGVWTWPLAWTRQRLEAPEQLDEAVHSGDLGKVRELMALAGTTLRTVIEIQLTAARAAAILDALNLESNGRARMQRWIDAVSMSELTAAGGGLFGDVDGSEDPEGRAQFLRLASQQPSVMALKQQTIDQLELKPGQQVLEAGCGLGAETAEMARRVGPSGNAVGIDLSNHMIDNARGLNDAATFVAMDVGALDFPDESFDAVRVERLLHVVLDPAQALRELVRVMKPGGRIVVAEPEWSSLRLKGVESGVVGRSHNRELAPGDGSFVERLMEASGLTVDDSQGLVGDISGGEVVAGLLGAHDPQVRDALLAGGADCSASLTMRVVIGTRP